MPTTRSATKRQTSLDEIADGNQSRSSKGSTRVQPAKPSSKDKQQATAKPEKRKSPPDATSNVPSKKSKQQHLSSTNAKTLEDPIVINRAPVLQLWGAVVAQFLHPELTWPACLSIGSAISTLCAISKGRAIGMVEPKDEDAKQGQDAKKEKTKKESRTIAVMGFDLHLKDDAVLLSGKPKPSKEDSLKNKFGEEQYEAAKKAMTDSVQSWSGAKDELDGQAFHMYEKFRPDVAKGQRGWGRKGELNLHELASVVERPKR